MQLNAKIIAFCAIIICFAVFIRPSIMPSTKSVKALVEATLRAQHGMAPKSVLKNIVTDECWDSISYYSNFFHGFGLYFVDADYMKTYKILDEDKSCVSVRLCEFFGDYYYQYFDFIRDDDGNYLISQFGFGK